jgi:hypothetical protein
MADNTIARQGDAKDQVLVNRISEAVALMNDTLDKANSAGIQVTLKLATIRRTEDITDRVTVTLEGAAKQLYTPLIIRPR